MSLFNQNNPNTKISKVFWVVLISFFIISAGAIAGSLTPSASPAGTMHTLSEIYDSIAGTFDSSAISSSTTGSLIQGIKALNSNLGWASGSNNIWNLNSGNVGIGTVSPVRKLEVYGSTWSNSVGSDLRVIDGGNVGAGISLFSYTDTTFTTLNSRYTLLATGATATPPNGSITIFNNSTNHFPFTIGPDDRIALGSPALAHPHAQLYLFDGSSSGSVASSSFAILSSQTTGSVASISASALTSGNILSVKVPNSNFTGNLFQFFRFNGASIASLSANGNFETSGYASLSNTLFVNSGNTGIGTTSPDAKLDINGNILASSSGAVDLTLNNNQQTYGKWVIRSMANPSDGRLDFLNNTTTLVSIASTGNVGIGTTAPTSKFYINYTGANPSNPVFRIDSSANATNVIDAYVNGGKMFQVDPNGAVIASSTLDIGGITGASLGDRSVNRVVAHISTSGLYTGGLPSYGLSVDPVGVSNNNTSAEQGAIYALLSGATSNNVTLKSYSIRADNTSTYVNNYGLYAQTTGAGTVNVAGYFSATGAGSNYGLIVANGNAGIGTTSPDQKLDVKGNILASTSGNVDLTLNSTTSDDSNFTIRNVGASSRLDILGSASQAFFSINKLGNVGIGTTAQAATLALTGSTYAIGDVKTHISFGSCGGCSVYTLLQQTNTLSLHNSGGWDEVEFGNVASIGNTFTVQRSGNAYFQNLSGNLGIGGQAVAVTTPTSRIGIVNNNGTVTGTFISMQNCSGCAAWKLGATVNNLSIMGDLNERVLTFGYNATWGANVGIGTTAPAALLDVTASISMTTGDLFKVASSSPANTLFIVKKSGNVGIGTGSPTSPLTLTITGANNPPASAIIINANSTTGVGNNDNALITFNHNNSSNGYSWVLGGGSGTYFGHPDNFGIRAASGNKNAIEIDTAGNVGIGLKATNMLAKLDVRASVSETTAELFNVASSTNTSVFRITKAGNVGIGTTSPSTKLQIVGGDCSDAAGGGGCTADYAEFYPAREDVEKGDVLVIDAASSLYGVRKSSHSYESNILGVVSTAPAAIADTGNLQFVANNYVLNPRKPAVALVGRVPVKVNLENGPIKKGDRLTSSSTSGQAMKATEAGITLGMALEDYNGADSDGKILAFLNVTYWAPKLPEQATVTIDSNQSMFDAFIAYLKDIVLTVKGLVADNVQTQEIQTSKICVGQTCVTEEQFKSVFGAGSVTSPTPEPSILIDSPTPSPITSIEASPASSSAVVTPTP